MALKFEQNRAGPKLESQKLEPSLRMRHEEHRYSLMFFDDASKDTAYRRLTAERQVAFQFGQHLQVSEHDVFDALA